MINSQAWVAHHIQCPGDVPDARRKHRASAENRKPPHDYYIFVFYAHESVWIFCGYSQTFQTSEQRLPILEYLRTYAENIRAAITILRILAQNPFVEYLHICAKIIHFSSSHLRIGAQNPCSDYVIYHRRIFCVVRRYSPEYSVVKIYAKTPPQEFLRKNSKFGSINASYLCKR